MFAYIAVPGIVVLSLVTCILVLSLVTWACSKHYLRFHHTHCEDDEVDMSTWVGALSLMKVRDTAL